MHAAPGGDEPRELVIAAYGPDRPGLVVRLARELAAAGANITDFGSAVWWAITTMTTVGYGDRFPTTGEGRLIGAALMLGGIALLGVVTATIASWVIERVQGDD